MKKGHYDTYLTIDGEDIPITVHYISYPFYPGAREGGRGPKLEPDEPAHSEIDWVAGPNGKAITLTDGQQKLIEEDLEDYMRYDPPEDW